MASEWIKLCHDTPLKPEVLEIADMLGVSRHAAFGLVMEFWLWVDRNSIDGKLRRLRDAHVDAVVSHIGLASALKEVGWLAEDEEGCLFVPNFDRHNGGTAKTRALRTERNSRHRGKNVVNGDAERDVRETQDRLSFVSRSPSTSPSKCIESLQSKDVKAEPKQQQPSQGISFESLAADCEVWELEWITHDGKTWKMPKSQVDSLKVLNPNADVERAIRSAWHDATFGNSSPPPDLSRWIRQWVAREQSTFVGRRNLQKQYEPVQSTTKPVDRFATMTQDEADEFVRTGRLPNVDAK